VLETSEFSKESALTAPEMNLLESYKNIIYIMSLMADSTEIKAKSSYIGN
jgi:hypothetical protein